MESWIIVIPLRQVSVWELLEAYRQGRYCSIKAKILLSLCELLLLNAKYWAKWKFHLTFAASPKTFRCLVQIQNSSVQSICQIKCYFSLYGIFLCLNTLL